MDHRSDQDRAWAFELMMGTDRIDRLCVQVCRDFEREVKNLPTWEQLAPFYGEA